MKKRYLHLCAYGLLVVMIFLVSLLVNSCVVQQTPQITSLLYEGKDYKNENFLEIKRTKEIEVKVTGVNGGIYLWKIDNIVFVNEQGKNKIKFKDYESSSELKNRLSEEFFKTPHQLTISVSSNNKTASITKQIKIINEAPEITINPDKIGPETSVVNVKIIDPENDIIAISNTEIVDTNGKVYWSAKETELNINLTSLNLVPNVYILRVYAKDQYGAEAKLEKYIRLKQTYSIIAVRYEEKNLRYYDEPFVVNRYGKFKVTTDIDTKATYKIEIGELSYINLDSITTNSTEVSFELKKYNNNKDVPWDEYFSKDKVVNLKIDLYNDKGILQDSFVKKIKIINEAPLIKVDVDPMSKTTRYATVTIVELDNDDVQSTIKLIRKGNPDTVIEEKINVLSWSKRVDTLDKGLYEIHVEAKDKFGKSNNVSEGINSSPVNEILRVKYEGQSMEYMQEPVKVNRVGEFDIDAKDTTNAKYTVKIDKITLLNQSTADTFKLKDHNSKLELSSDFFNMNHTLTIELYSQQNGSTVLQDSFTKTIKIANLPPKIEFNYDNVSKILTVTISEPEGDNIVYKQGQLIDSSGKVISTWTDLSKEINVASLPRGNYTVVVMARDEFGAEQERRQEITSLTYQNNPPSVSILQPYNNEKTPVSLTARWRGQDPDNGDVLRYKLVLKTNGTDVLTIETTSTEAILPNLNYDTTYSIQVTVYDLQNASSTAQVTFKTVSSPRYSYILSKSFDGKSVINIANTYSLPTVKIEGFVALIDNVSFTDFDVAEDYIYAVGGTNLYVINASDKSNPKIVKKVDLGTTLSAIKIYKNYAIIGEGSNGIRLVDLTNPSEPILTSKNFGKTLKTFTLPVNSVFSKTSKTTNSKINITQGKIMTIKLAADSAYIANNIGGLLRLNLSNVPNITINDIRLIYDNQINDLEIGQFNNEQVIALAVGKDVKYVKLADAERSDGELPPASITSLSGGTFDTEVKGVRIYNNSLYAFTIDRIRKWTNNTSGNNIEYEPGSQFNDLLFVGDNSVVLDGGRGLITYRNDSKYEPDKMYKLLDLNYINNFLFGVGDGFYCNGLYVIDLRNVLEPTVRRYDTGEYFNKIDVKLKAVPKTSSEKVAKIVVANTETISAKLYDFDYANLTLSQVKSLNLTGYQALYDVAIDAQGRAYVLGRKAGNNIIEIFDQNGNTIRSSVLPVNVDQRIPKISVPMQEAVEPRSIQVVVDYLSQSQNPSYLLVTCGRAGTIRYKLGVDSSGNITSLSQDLEIPTTYYVVVEEQGGGTYRLQRYNPGIDSAVAVDKYFDRIFIADGDYNGIWILDRNGTNLIEKESDDLSKTPLFAGAPARNISWFGDLLFVSGGGSGVKIVSIRNLGAFDATRDIISIPFNGLTYAFHTEADARIMVVGSDKGLLLYDISEFPVVKPISTLNLPMFKIISK
ncbi:MAG: hypothetical protein N2Z58_06160 [Fervidobacterium sp.]|nr:hypothetical protein [Fervidobacterium sp.]